MSPYWMKKVFSRQLKINIRDIDIFNERLKLKKVVCLLAAAMLCLGLTACNTVKGVGQDVSAVGGDIDSAATAVQNKM